MGFRAFFVVFSVILVSSLSATVAFADLTVTTLAGTGDHKFNNDQQTGLITNVNPKGSMAVHPFTHELYFTDAGDGGNRGNTRIRKIGSDGRVTTVAGTGQTQFNGDGAALSTNLKVGGLVFHPQTGELFFDGGYRICKLANGAITTIAGTGDGREFNMDGDPLPEGDALKTNITPGSFAFHPVTRELYFADQGRIRKIADGNVVTVAGTGKEQFNGDHDGLSTNLDTPENLLFHPSDGGLYFREFHRRIRVLTDDGKIKTLTGEGVESRSYDRNSAPLFMAFNPAGELFFVNRSKKRDGTASICRLEADGRVTQIAGTEQSQFADHEKQQLRISWIGFHPTSRELYFTDSHQTQQGPSLIRRLSNKDLSSITVAGSGKREYNGDSLPLETNIDPQLLAFSPTGDLYFTHGGENRELGASRIRVLRGLPAIAPSMPPFPSIHSGGDTKK